MTAKQYRLALKQLGVEITYAGVLFGYASATGGRNWAKKGPTPPVAILIELMLTGKITKADVEAARLTSDARKEHDR